MPSSRPLRAAAWLLALLLCPALAPAAAAPAAGGNLLTNPGFEKPLGGHPWMPAGWDTSEAALPTVYFGRDTFMVHEGHYAVNVANTSNRFPLWHNWSQAVVVGREAWNKDLVLSVWTRSNGVDGRGYVLLQAYRDTIGKMATVWHMDRDAAGKKLGINKVDDPLLDQGWQRRFFSDAETDWVRRELRVFVPPLTNIVYVRCGLVGTGQVLFDDAALTLEPARPQPAVALGANLLADPGFEGDGNDWEYSMPPYEGLTFAHDSTVAHGGRASIRYEGGLEGFFTIRAGMCQFVGNHNLAGQRVRLTAYVKTDSLKTSAYLKLYSHSLGRGRIESAPGPTVTLTRDWTPLAIEMDMPDDTYGVWAWLAYNCPAGGRVWYDDAKLEVLGPVSAMKEPVVQSRPTGSVTGP